MKRKDTMIGMALVAFAAVAGFAQTSQPDRVVVPLTDPAKPAFVEVQILMGSIKVTGYEGKEVIVEATVREKAVARVREGVVPLSRQSPPSRPRLRRPDRTGSPVITRGRRMPHSPGRMKIRKRRSRPTRPGRPG